MPDAAPPSSLATVGDCTWTKCHPRPVCGPRYGAKESGDTMRTRRTAALISMIIVQFLAGVKIDPVISVIFVLISISGIIFGIIALRNIRD